MSGFSNFSKRSVLSVLLMLIVFTLSAMEISVYTVGDLMQDDEYHYSYLGGELRVSGLDTFMPFASVGFSAGNRSAIDSVSETTSTSTFSSRKRTARGINTYLATVKTGIEYRREGLNGYRYGIGIYGVFRDHIRDEKDSSTNENKIISDFTYGVGAEVNAIMPFMAMNDNIQNPLRAALTFKISGAYDFKKLWNLGISVGGIFSY